MRLGPIVDFRLVVDRAGFVRASVDGTRIEIPPTRSVSTALIYLSRRFEAPPVVPWHETIDPATVRQG